MLFMVIEKHRDGDPKPVYRRFKDFEVIPIITSERASAAIAPHL